jgi:prevent-host-death family protein
MVNSGDGYGQGYVTTLRKGLLRPLSLTFRIRLNK